MAALYTLKGNYFNNKFHIPRKISSEIIKYSPAELNKHLWTFALSDEHIEDILQSANDGFKVWKNTPMEERIKRLLKYKDNLLKNQKEIATAIAWETGKPFQECLVEATGLASKIDVTINESLKRINNYLLTDIIPGITGHFRYKPLGPILIIGPFNFPCHLANGQIVSALLAGNSIIFKPSEKTAYSPQLMIDCLHESNFPSGVINFFLADGHLTSKISNSKAIKGIHFTGSKEVGSKIAQSVASDFSKLLALELGGKNSTIVHHDANFDHSLAECINSCFLTSGQRCTSTSLLFVHKKLLLKFQNDFSEITKKIQVDHPFSASPFMGPLIDEVAEKHYAFYQAKALEEGAHILLPAQKVQTTYKGYYWSPSIFLYDSENKNKSFIHQEIFAPNVTIIPYENIEEAVNVVNSSEYGLAFSVFTSDKSIADYCLQEVDAGILNINRSTVGASAKLPFGGCKNSGNFRPAGVTMIDSCVQLTSTLETLTHCNSSWKSISGIKM